MVVMVQQLGLIAATLAQGQEQQAQAMARQEAAMAQMQTTLAQGQEQQARAMARQEAAGLGEAAALKRQVALYEQAMRQVGPVLAAALARAPQPAPVVSSATRATR